MIEDFAKLIPKHLLDKSGSVFYSGREAFNSCSRLYILGLNPGGSPEKLAASTVRLHTENVLTGERGDWSAYQDESWQGRPAGTHGLQPRVLHLVRGLDLEPRHVPSSNVVFVRSARQIDLMARLPQLLEDCWPFHQKVIDGLGVKVVLCFGRKAGEAVSKRLKADECIGTFKEDNKRGWLTRASVNSNGIAVVAAAHPSIADWTASATDPTPFVRKIMRDLNKEP